MSQNGDGFAIAEVVARKAAAIPPIINTGGARSSDNPFASSRPPSIHDATSSNDSSSSDEDEGEMFEARRRRKAKMNALVEKKVRNLMKKLENQGRNRKASFLRNTSSASQLRPIAIFFFTFQSCDSQFSRIMTKRFEISMMGELKFFLGFQIKQLTEGTFIFQTSTSRICSRSLTWPMQSQS